MVGITGPFFGNNGLSPTATGTGNEAAKQRHSAAIVTVKCRISEKCCTDGLS
jgi:hypothetical protein